jgi:hypothetical protein
MKSFMRKIILLLIIAAAFYAAICAYMPVRKGMMGVVTDRRSGSIVSVAEEERRFIWLWRFFLALCRGDPAQTAIRSLSDSVVIPSLALLKGDFYNINIPVRAGYSIDPASMADISLLKDEPPPLKKPSERKSRPNSVRFCGPISIRFTGA